MATVKKFELNANGTARITKLGGSFPIIGNQEILPITVAPVSETNGFSTKLNVYGDVSTTTHTTPVTNSAQIATI